MKAISLEPAPAKHAKYQTRLAAAPCAIPELSLRTIPGDAAAARAIVATATRTAAMHPRRAPRPLF